ncbi:BnaC04g31550D [Brassica napus]|uniref:BnaC04g31550D protein n=1 Tax=Brassica napus TaxID=3708 RepID=A0A078GYL3_BRANA|nr:BnaC04g31550D [Brassica napus]
MTIRELRSEESVGGTCLLLSLPEDVFAATSRFLSPSDICNLSLCCKSLCDLVDSEKIWFVQCELVKALPLSEIVRWRIGISSYKALCRFLVEVVKPLVGVWVHQEPELGNVVYVMPGFLSVVGCRIIPQKVGPFGIQEGRLMWSPVFEIICDHDDGSTKFFLHGRGREGSCVYPGLVTGIDKTCNVLSLEVEPRREKKLCSGVPFQKLDDSDRRNLLELVTSHVGVHVSEPLSGKLFPTRREDEGMLLERRTMLLKIHKFGKNWKHINLEEDGLCYNPTQVDINEMGASPCVNRRRFLSAGDIFGLSLKASYTEMSSYKGWPRMDLNRFCLHKLPIKSLGDDQEYAGLWGGTFGWPPGRCNEDETGNAFYLLMLSYEESRKNNGKRLVGTKILEGNDFVQHPNGTPMFVVRTLLIWKRLTQTCLPSHYESVPLPPWQSWKMEHSAADIQSSLPYLVLFLRYKLIVECLVTSFASLHLHSQEKISQMFLRFHLLFTYFKQYFNNT